MKAITEAVGRCIEMGKPILYAGGNSLGGLTSPRGPGHLAGLDVLGQVASEVAKRNGEIVAVVSWPEQLQIAQAVVEEAFVSAGNPSGFDPESVYFISDRSWPYCMAVMSLIDKIRPAAFVPVGSYSGEALLMSETGSMFGAFIVGGTESIAQVPYFFVVCDFTLIGPEVIAAGASVSRNPVSLGSLAGEDMIKILSIVFIIAGTLLAMFRVKLG
jgi:hypothetical protein